MMSAWGPDVGDDSPGRHGATTEPVLVVDRSGRVVGADHDAASWLGVDERLLLGNALAERFAQDDAVAVKRLASSGWLGVGEHDFTLADGRKVTLHAAPSADSPGIWRIALHDATMRHLLDRAADERRRMRALADFAGALARELNDPMSIVQGRLELLLELGESDPAAVERNLRVALDHARRISAALRNLRLVGQAPAPTLVPVLVSDAVDEALDLVGPRQRAAELKVDLQPGDLTTGGDLALCARVIANLLNYALDHVSRGARVELRGRRLRDRVVLRVLGGAVTGSSLGEPLDIDGNLGLSVARTLATSIGGELDARKVTGGVNFTVSLPAPPDRPARARRTGDRLLVVGREATARSFETLLEMDGVRVVRCAHGEGALSLLDGGEDYDAIATELFLDGMSGLTFAQEATKRHPDMGRVLLVTDARLGPWPPDVVAVTPPLDRTLVLEALGRRVRRRRT